MFPFPARRAAPCSDGRGEGNDVGLCAPHPHQGVPPWTRYTMGLGFKKSAGFCVGRGEGDAVGLCAPHPHQGVPPWTRFTILLGLRKSTGFCVEQGRRCGAMRPTPPPGSSSLDPVHNFTGFKKSTGFCVEQQERMCCIVLRQRLSVRSGPGQPVDRGFSGNRVWGKTSFPPERSPENRFLPRGTWP